MFCNYTDLYILPEKKSKEKRRSKRDKHDGQLVSFHIYFLSLGTVELLTCFHAIKIDQSLVCWLVLYSSTHYFR